VSALVDRIRSAFLTGDTSAFADLVAPDAEIRNPFTTVHGPDGFAGLAHAFTSGFGERAIEYRCVLASGDAVAVEMHVSSRHEATGRPVAFDEIAILRIAGGRIASWHSYYDAAALARQIGSEDAGEAAREDGGGERAAA
jgi:ketosteroid isomerase-like protein